VTSFRSKLITIDAIASHLHTIRPSVPLTRLRAVLTQLRWCAINSVDGLIRITYQVLAERCLRHHGEEVTRMWLCRFMPTITLGYPRGRAGTIDDSAVILPMLRMVRKGDPDRPDANGNTWSVYESLPANWGVPGDETRDGGIA
jgi:hypothetical protein